MPTIHGFARGDIFDRALRRGVGNTHIIIPSEARVSGHEDYSRRQILDKVQGVKEPNHVKKLRVLIATGHVPAQAGSMSQVTVAHDTWCRSFKGKPCNCDPDIRVAWTLGAHAQN
jgi:hypothetical protein